MQDQILQLRGKSQIFELFETLHLWYSFCCDCVWSENVHGFNNTQNGRVETGFQMINFWLSLMVSFKSKNIDFPSNISVHWWVGCFRNCNIPLTLQIQLLRRKFVEELSALFGSNCANALEANSIVNNCIVGWLWSCLLDKLYHRYSHPVHPLWCILGAFWKKL